jgi:hypothetical protein
MSEILIFFKGSPRDTLNQVFTFNTEKLISSINVPSEKNVILSEGFPSAAKLPLAIRHSEQSETKSKNEEPIPHNNAIP